MSIASPLLLTVAVLFTTPGDAYKPNPTELRESYQRADQLSSLYNSKALKLRLDAEWFDRGNRFWYVNRLAEGRREYIQVEAATGNKSPLFDAKRLAEALKTATGNDYDPAKLELTGLEVEESGSRMDFTAGGSRWRMKFADYLLEKIEAERPPQGRRNPPWRQDLNPPDPQPRNSPDGKWTARIIDNNLHLGPAGGELKPVTTGGNPKGYFARVSWAPDSQRLLIIRVTPGDRGMVHLVESSPEGGGRAKLESRVYDQPGDKVDTFDHWIVDVNTLQAVPSKAETVDYGGMPWPQWTKNGKAFRYEKMDRGYGRWRFIEVDSNNGEPRTIIDEDPSTFVDSTSMYLHRCVNTPELIFRSERDGWGHLYLIDADTGAVKSRITSGQWVVRGVNRVDEANREIWFTASGRESGQDPYFIHYYRVKFDGTGLTQLTDGDGNHEVRFSPDSRYLLDTWSRPDKAPVHDLRDARTGKLIKRIEEADISGLPSTGWRAPQVFVAKARDGKTDIWGLVYRPSHFDPKKRYPVIEDIYAGPHDSFVPKTFAAYRGFNSLAELGFIVVKIDGMGTRNRGKAFQDVAYKNLADAGLPDRILWMKALAKTDPSLDLDRVGVFGTSAGGQSSTGALLFHPDFYKVAVSSCGCHDNRMDKIWWNEQWMGLMGPHYAEQSNITNANKLRGKLLLMVGELDDNVPPESTYRLADALNRANKDYELLVLTGAGHTAGGAYGERRRRDFFVRHLLGVEPPDWNRE